jgi:3-methyladenine DNA glycosylase AlkD
MHTAKNVINELSLYEDPVRAQFAGRFFKTGKGQYGEGDLFLGLSVPDVRKVAKKFADLPLQTIEQLLESDIHEHRLVALIIMTNQAKRASDKEHARLYNLYLRRTDRINNWDLVDTSCRDVVGGYLLKRSRRPLYKLAQSPSLWERRIAIVSTWQFIREGDLDDTFKISALLLNDKEDLIHKATGWMLREAGKKEPQQLINFLNTYATKMPRTMLRYAIERLSSDQRTYFLRLK